MIVLLFFGVTIVIVLLRSIREYLFCPAVNAEKVQAQAEKKKQQLMNNKLMGNKELKAYIRDHYEATFDSVILNDDGSVKINKDELSPSTESSATTHLMGSAIITTTKKICVVGMVTRIEPRDAAKFAWQGFLRGLKPLAAYAQIATSISFNCDISFPLIFSSFLVYFNVINLDIFPYLGLQCHEFDYIHLMAATTLSPLVMALFFVAAFRIAHHRQRQSETSIKAAKNRVIFAFLLFSFLILASVSTRLFQFFRCDSFEEVDPVQMYVKRDYSVSCTSSRYQTATILAFFGIAVYPVGIPLMYGCLLWQHRSLLGNAAAVEAEAAQGYPNTQHLKFLFERYAPKYFLFEVVECARRLSLASLIGVVSPDSAAAPTLGLLISGAFVPIYFTYRPYKEEEDNSLEIALAQSLVLLFLEALLLKVDAADDDENSRHLFGVLLVIVFLVGPAMVLAKLIWIFVERCSPPALSTQRKLAAGQGKSSQVDLGIEMVPHERSEATPGRIDAEAGSDDVVGNGGGPSAELQRLLAAGDLEDCALPLRLAGLHSVAAVRDAPADALRALPKFRMRRLQHLARQHCAELGEEGAAGGGGGQLANGPARTPAVAATGVSAPWPGVGAPRPGPLSDDELEAGNQFTEDEEGVEL